MGERALAGEVSLIASENEYDWLGPGSYFWEGDDQRALDWAESEAKRKGYDDPFVIGAVIDLGNCLDLLIRENLKILENAYQDFKAKTERASKALPVNRNPKGMSGDDKLFRYLDCAVIRHLHTEMAKNKGLGDPFDTVRGLFVEGEPVYEGGGFYSRTHTQIAVRNDKAIKGLFRLRS